SERLTRIELDLDVVPTNPSEAMTLALHVAHRRAEADLRRFKAHVEFISPDAYQENGHGNGNGNGSSGGRRGNARNKGGTSCRHSHQTAFHARDTSAGEARAAW